MVSKVLTAQEGPSGQEGAEEPEEGRMTMRASNIQKVTYHPTEEQGMPRKPLSSHRVNRRRSSCQESSNGQGDADPPGRCRSARSTPNGHESARVIIMAMSGQGSAKQPAATTDKEYAEQVGRRRVSRTRVARRVSSSHTPSSARH